MLQSGRPLKGEITKKKNQPLNYQPESLQEEVPGCVQKYGEEFQQHCALPSVHLQQEKCGLSLSLTMALAQLAPKLSYC